jgi:hypothetical protein
MYRTKTRKLGVAIGLVLTLALMVSSQRALAFGNPCLEVYVNQTASLTSATTTTGTIPHGGILTGTTTDTFTSALVATPDPDAFSFTDTFTITTRGGTLTSSDVTIFDTTHLLFSSIQRVSSGTGIFAGATGTLFSSGSSTDGVNFTDKIIGQICFAFHQ